MKIVLDTNVLISGFLFGGKSKMVIEKCLETGDWFISTWIEREFENKLRQKFSLPETEIERVFGNVEKGSIRIDPKNPLPTICRDPDDNQILRLAEYVGADFLVTGDKDLLVLEKFGATEILNPTDFLERIKS